MLKLAIFLAAGSLFGQATPPNAWQFLDHAAHDTNPIKRQQAVLAMGVLRPQAPLIASMENALDDKDSSVREAACISLGQVNARISIPKLQMTLADAVPEVVFAAARALYTMGDSTGRQVLAAILLGDQKDASSVLAGAMHDTKLKFHDPKGLLMFGVTHGAGFAGPFGAGMPIAIDLMKDSQASGKTTVALLLATDHSPETLRALQDALADKNWTVRAAAARAIALRDASGLYDDVARLLSDKREEVQLAAAATMVRLKQPAR
ncbi:MAG TPA: HEAT repeat domain-containing protein [Bryobacteraceae bacterium]|nr:HEAT repeat domain-containing protein [Bryobacteraceae bacterium]